jgi:ABC-2 type transport system permease protein
MILLNSIYNEIIKIALKPRSYLGLAAITVLVGVIQFALKADGMSIISFVTSSFNSYSYDYKSFFVFIS